MPTFQLTLAHDVSVYGHVEVEADDLAAAVERLRREVISRNGPAIHNLWDDVSDVDYSTSCNFRIVRIEDEDDTTLLEAIDLDGTAEEVLSAVTAQRISV